MTDTTQGAFLVFDEAKYGHRQRNKKTAAQPGSGRRRSASTKPTFMGPRDCEACGLYHNVNSPKMEPCGEGRQGIVVVGESPGSADDRRGKLFCGDSGELLREAFSKLGLRMERDVMLTNVIQCTTPASESGKQKSANRKFRADCCHARLDKQLLDFKPKLIMTFGAEAARSVLSPPFDVTVNKVRGLIFPSQRYGCWVSCSYDPEYLIDGRVDELMDLFVDDMARGLEYYGKSVPPLLSRDSGCTILGDIEIAIEFLKKATLERDRVVGIDFETTSVQPYHNDSKVFCLSMAYSEDEGFFIPLEYGDFWTKEQKERLYTYVRAFLVSDAPKTIQNRAMEEKWTTFLGQTTGSKPIEIGNVVNDTMITAHVIEPRADKTKGQISGLAFQVFQLNGDTYKDEMDLHEFGAYAKEPLDKAVKYSCLDSRYLVKSHKNQMVHLADKLNLKRAAEFFSSRVITLIRMEKRGMALNLKLLNDQETESRDIIKECETYFNESKHVQLWKNHTAKRNKVFNPGSDKDLREFFWDVLDLPKPDWRTDGDQLPTSRAAIEWLKGQVKDTEFITLCDMMVKHSLYSTKLNTFILGFKSRLYADGLMHPEFLLNFVESMRSSSMNPNWQNLPKRNEEQADFRRLIIPYYGDLFNETDASGSEIVTAAMLSQCIELIRQLKAGVDVHRRWAARLFEITEDRVSKKQRSDTKNGFVFPEFYGAHHGGIAAQLSLPKEHVIKVEQQFWKEYRELRAWQEHTADVYATKGYVEMPMGFRRYAPLSKRQIFNTPIQGTSFHMLLEALYRADNDMIEKGMRSCLVAEIHDSILTDLVKEETEDARKILIKRMTEKQFDWQGSVPRGAEMQEGPNWYDMETVSL